jgi:hypothetical protein
VQKNSSNQEDFKAGIASVPPQPLTVKQNVILTIKVLVVAALIFGALWGFDRLME